MLATKQLGLFAFSSYKIQQYFNIVFTNYIISCMTLFDNNTDHAE